MSIEQQDSLPGKIMTRDFVMTSSSPLHGRATSPPSPRGERIESKIDQDWGSLVSTLLSSVPILVLRDQDHLVREFLR